MFSGFWGEGRTYDMYLKTIEDPDALPGFIRFEIGENGPETEITRSDAIVAFYRYTEKILEKEVNSNGSISKYADSEKFPIKDSDWQLYRNAHRMYTYADGYLTDLYGEDALTKIWLWAIDTGIIEGYPDGTLRPDAAITRAEFATMLTRFMDYVK